MGLRSNRKGKVWEREVAAKLRNRDGWDAERMAPLQARTNSIAPDVLAEVLVFSHDRDPQPYYKKTFAIECKAGQRIRWMEAMEQAAEVTSNTSAVPMVVAKIDNGKNARKQPVVMLRLDDFLDLIEELR